MIEFKNVSYHYGKEKEKTTALKNIGLAVNEGEFVAILGPNGSGKSTLARHMNGLLIPSQGEVLVDGLSTRESGVLWHIHQQVGMVFQNPDNQIIATSVEDDIAFGPENLGLDPKEIRERVDEALEIVGMQSYARHEPHMLSGGQKQRVAVAGALAMRPKYLVVDEATSMLDPRASSSMLESLKRLNKDYGITVVNITHIPDEAVLADRVLILFEGRIVKDGPPQEVFLDLNELREVGVGAPKARQIAEELIASGINLPRSILTIDELVSDLC